MKKCAALPDAMSEDRQCTAERRLFSYTGFIPERRCGYDRRDAVERRRFSYTNFIPERRSGKDRRNVAVLFCPSRPASDRSLDGKWAFPQ